MGVAAVHLLIMHRKKFVQALLFEVRYMLWDPRLVLESPTTDICISSFCDHWLRPSGSLEKTNIVPRCPRTMRIVSSRYITSM